MQMVTATMKLKDSCSLGVGGGEGNYDQLDNILKSRHYFAYKGLYSQSYGFSISHEWMWELDPEELVLWTVTLEKSLERPLDCKQIKPANPKWNQPWIFIGRTDAIAEAPILLPPDVKNLLTGKDPDAGKDWRQEEKGTTEDEMVGWHHWLNWQEFEQALGVGGGQGSLVCCSPWVRVRHKWATELPWTDIPRLLRILMWEDNVVTGLWKCHA